MVGLQKGWFDVGVYWIILLNVWTITVLSYQISKLSLVKFSKFKMFRRQKGWFECGWIILLNIQTVSRENGFKSDKQNVANVKIQNVWASERVVRVWRVLDYPFQRSRHLRCHANKIIAIKMVIIIVNMVMIMVNIYLMMMEMPDWSK